MLRSCCCDSMMVVHEAVGVGVGVELGSLVRKRWRRHCNRVLQILECWLGRRGIGHRLKITRRRGREMGCLAEESFREP